MRTVWPAPSLAVSINACHAVNATIGTAAASTQVSDFGLAAVSCSVANEYPAVTATPLQADVREHRITCFKFRDLASDLLNNSSDVRSRNYRKHILFIFRKHSRPNHGIDGIHAGRDHPNENLILFGFRALTLAYFNTSGPP